MHTDDLQGLTPDSLIQLLSPRLCSIPLVLRLPFFFLFPQHLIAHPAASWLCGHRLRQQQSCWKAWLIFLLGLILLCEIQEADGGGRLTLQKWPESRQTKVVGVNTSIGHSDAPHLRNVPVKTVWDDGWKPPESNLRL